MVAYSAYTDQELVVLLKQGDRVAFTVLYERYWRMIYAHVFNMLRDEDEAKDILQDLFSSLWSRADLLPEQEQGLSAYLYRAAKNRVLNQIRRSKYRDDYLSSLAAFADDMSNVTIEELEEKDLIEALEREIEKLPPRMKQVFEMSRKQHLSNKEIAERLGVSDETVKKQIHNSLKVIKAGLKHSAGAGLALLMIMR